MVYRFNNNDVDGIINELKRIYPEYLQEAERLREIIIMMDCSEITMLVEENYIDKQYRDSYYDYFSQKYSTYKRNCIRLSFFEGYIDLENFFDYSFDLDKVIIGTVVLRPLKTGNIGNTLISPDKWKAKGYFRKCAFKIMVFGRKIYFEAFPFSSQDGETMTCAENALYNLIRYYSRKYPEYREMMPSEILHDLEKEHYERVLPSEGMRDENIAKILSNYNFYPKLYAYQFHPEFDKILYAYIESGLPLLLGVPGHVVTCIGHCFKIERTDKEYLKQLVSTYTVGDEQLHYLPTSDIYDKYIVMDDNKAPYQMLSVDELVDEYKDGRQDDSDTEKQNALDKAKQDDVSIIVPLYRRIFLDAEKAMIIFKKSFLEEPIFISVICNEYNDSTWGKENDNPLVWRMFLTTSKNYKAHKTRYVDDPLLKKHYMEWSMPHFVWALEIGTIDTYIDDRARAEILLDATSYEHSRNCGILSIGYKNHYVYVQDKIFTIENMAAREETAFGRIFRLSIGSATAKEPENFLTTIMETVYNTECSAFDDTFKMFINSNLKGNS